MAWPGRRWSEGLGSDLVVEVRDIERLGPVDDRLENGVERPHQRLETRPTFRGEGLSRPSQGSLQVIDAGENSTETTEGDWREGVALRPLTRTVVARHHAVRPAAADEGAEVRRDNAPRGSGLRAVVGEFESPRKGLEHPRGVQRGSVPRGEDRRWDGLRHLGKAFDGARGRNRLRDLGGDVQQGNHWYGTPFRRRTGKRHP